MQGDSIAAVLSTGIRDTLEKHDCHFNWTSLRLNFDTLSRWHSDDGVTGDIAIFAVGNF